MHYTIKLFIISFFINSNAIKYRKNSKYYNLYYKNNSNAYLIANKINWNNYNLKYSSTFYQLYYYFIYLIETNKIPCYLCDIKNVIIIKTEDNNEFNFELFKGTKNNKLIILLHGIANTSTVSVGKKIKYYIERSYDVGIFWRKGYTSSLSDKLIISDASFDRSILSMFSKSLEMTF